MHVADFQLTSVSVFESDGNFQDRILCNTDVTQAVHHSRRTFLELCRSLPCLLNRASTLLWLFSENQQGLVDFDICCGVMFPPLLLQASHLQQLLLPWTLQCYFLICILISTAET